MADDTLVRLLAELDKELERPEADGKSLGEQLRDLEAHMQEVAQLIRGLLLAIQQKDQR